MCSPDWKRQRLPRPCAAPQEPVPEPLVAGNYHRPTSTCLLLRDFQPVVLEQQGFEWRNERPDAEMAAEKWGWIADAPGAWALLQFDTTTNLRVRRRHCPAGMWGMPGWLARPQGACPLWPARLGRWAGMPSALRSSSSAERPPAPHAPQRWACFHAGRAACHATHAAPCCAAGGRAPV